MDSFEGVQNDPRSLHKYLYANANPVSRVDPSGNFSIAEAVETLEMAALRGYTFLQFSPTIQLIKAGLQIANLLGLVFSEHYRNEFLALGPEAANFIFEDFFEVVSSAKAGIRNYSELLQLRQGYEAEVKGLQTFASELQSAGKTTEEIAKEMTTARRIIGMRYKDASPSNIREAIFARNLDKYQDPLGPTYDYLRNVKGYSDEQIIQSSMKPEGGDFWWIWIARKLGLL
jgi:hypothetical protein